MNSANHPTQPSSHLKDVVAFVVTVAVCSFLLIVSCTFTKTDKIFVVRTPLRAMPLPPAPLELAQEPASGLPEMEVAWVLPDVQVAACFSPEMEAASIFPALEVFSASLEAITDILSAPDKAVPHKPIPFHGIIVQAAGRYEVDPHLIRAIIFAESGFNPKAKSKKGARGLMQLMPSTAKSLGVDDIYDPEENINGGVRYFRSLLDRFEGDVKLALAAYNAGSRHVRKYDGVPPFRATQLYIKKVLKFQKKFKSEMAALTNRLA